MNVQTISNETRIKQLQDELKALKELQPTKVTSEATINKREFSNEVMAILLPLNKTAKAVKQHLDGCDANCFTALLTDKQKENFVSSRFASMLKSVSLTVKCMTPTQYKAFKVDGNKCTPNNYLSAIVRGCTMSDNQFKKCKKAKNHYSTDVAEK